MSRIRSYSLEEKVIIRAGEIFITRKIKLDISTFEKKTGLPQLLAMIVEQSARAR
jgi:hypothetical protein